MTTVNSTAWSVNCWSTAGQAHPGLVNIVNTTIGVTVNIVNAIRGATVTAVAIVTRVATPVNTVATLVVTSIV